MPRGTGPHLRKLAGVLFLCAAALFGWDLHTPAQVPWLPASIDDRRVERAEGLVLQQEVGGDVWASRGFSVYRSHEGGPFVREFTLWPRVGLAWAGFSEFLRDRFGYQELIEVVPLDARTVLVFGGGDVYRVQLDSGRQQWVHRLRYFGRGEGRGVMPHGIPSTIGARSISGSIPLLRRRPPAPSRSSEVMTVARPGWWLTSSLRPPPSGTCTGCNGTEKGDASG